MAALYAVDGLLSDCAEFILWYILGIDKFLASWSMHCVIRENISGPSMHERANLIPSLGTHTLSPYHDDMYVPIFVAAWVFWDLLIIVKLALFLPLLCRRLWVRCSGI
jgi:hypothetical protein